MVPVSVYEMKCKIAPVFACDLLTYNWNSTQI